MSADTPHAAVERFVALMVDDPVRGRVLLLAVDPYLERLDAADRQTLTDAVRVLHRQITGDFGALARIFRGLLRVSGCR